LGLDMLLVAAISGVATLIVALCMLFLNGDFEVLFVERKNYSNNYTSN